MSKVPFCGRYSVGTNVGKSMDYKTNDPTYTFEILGGLGEKPYAPVVEFLVRDDSAGENSRRASFRDEVSAPAVPKKKINVDMSLCTIIPRPDLVTSVSQTPTTGFGSAVELCVTKEEKQVRANFVYMCASLHKSSFFGIRSFLASSPSLTPSLFCSTDCPIFVVFQI